MGWFSDEIETYVGTSVSRVIDDAMLPDSAKTGLIKGIFNEGDLSSYVMEDLIGSVGIRAERMYEYGKNNYTHGLPSGQFRTADDGSPEVIAVLTALEMAPISLQYCHYGPPNKLHIGWMSLIADHGYNPATNQLANLTAAKSTPVYLSNMIVVVPAALVNSYKEGVLTQWGLPATAGYTPERKFQTYTGSLRAPTLMLADPAATEAYVRVDYVWVTPSLYAESGPETVLATGSFNISLAAYDSTLSYFHAYYTVGGVAKYWMYQDNLGTYPTLDVIFAPAVQTNGEFFPFAYFRYNSVSEIANTTTPSYATTKKLLKYLGLPFDRMAEAIDTNPDIASVRQAMMIMAVPANSVDPQELRYLYSFFDNLFASDANQFLSPVQGGIAALQATNPYISASSLIIQDARFKMALTHSGIYKKRVGGTIGAIGTCTMGTGTAPVSRKYMVMDGEGVEYESTHIVNITYHYYRKQISHALYDEIRIDDLRMLYYIVDGLYSVGDSINAVLLVPIDRSITHLYSASNRERLYSRSLHYVFNSVQEVHVKWYQQSWFSFVLLVVAVVTTVIGMGTDGGAFISAVLAGNTAAISALAWVLIEKLVIGLLLGAAFKLFVKAVGVKAAIALTVIAAAFGLYKGIKAGSLKGAPWATELLEVSSGLIGGIKTEMKEMFGELLDEYKSFNIFKDEATKSLEAANKMLEHNNWLSPFVVFGEKPDDYYNRTVHSGNIGVLGIGAISSFVDTALTLPRIDETIAG